MRKVFHNSNQVQCIFSDEGVSFYGEDQEVFFPYGCIETIKMSLMGILQVSCLPRFSSFSVDGKDRAAVKEMIKYAKEAMKTAPKAKPQVFDHSGTRDNVDSALSPAEQLKQYKTLFIRGEISKEEYDAKKRLLKE